MGRSLRDRYAQKNKGKVAVAGKGLVSRTAKTAAGKTYTYNEGLKRLGQQSEQRSAGSGVRRNTENSEPKRTIRGVSYENMGYNIAAGESGNAYDLVRAREDIARQKDKQGKVDWQTNAGAVPYEEQLARYYAKKQIEDEAKNKNSGIDKIQEQNKAQMEGGDIDSQLLAEISQKNALFMQEQARRNPEDTELAQKAKEATTIANERTNTVNEAREAAKRYAQNEEIKNKNTAQATQDKNMVDVVFSYKNMEGDARAAEYIDKGENKNTAQQKGEELGKQGLAIYNAAKDKGMTDSQALREATKIQNINADYAKAGAAALTDNDAMLWAGMSDEYKKIYNYILGKYGENSAEFKRFKSAIRDEVIYNYGQLTDKTIDKYYEDDVLGDFGKVAGKTAYSFGTGVFDGSAKGMYNLGAMLVGDKGVSTTYLNAGQQGISQNAEGLEKLLYDLAYTEGNMLPSILTGQVASSVLGNIVMGAGIAGNSYAQAREEGYSYEQAVSYSLVNSSLEVFMERFLGGIDGLAAKGGLTKMIMSKGSAAIERLIKNPKLAFVVSKILGFVGSGGGEFTEEYLQQFLEPIYRNIIFDENNEINFFAPENFEAGFMGLLMASVSNGVSQAGNAVYFKQNGENVRLDGGLEGLVESGKESARGTMSNRLAEDIVRLQESGKPVSDWEISMLMEANKGAIADEEAASRYLDGRGSWGELSQEGKRAMLNPDNIDFNNERYGLEIPQGSNPSEIGQYLREYADSAQRTGRKQGISQNIIEIAQGVQKKTGTKVIFEDMTNSQRNGGEKYSIAKTTNGKNAVVVDEDILENVPKGKWANTVNRVLREKFADGITVKSGIVAVNQASRREVTNGGNSAYYKRKLAEVYGDKLKAVNNLDEIIEASENYVGEANIHKSNNSAKIKEFARGNVLLQIGANKYTAEVVIGTRNDGSMVFYDIVNLIPDDFKIKTDRQGGGRTKSSASSLLSASIDNSIRKKNENINSFGENNTKIKDVTEDIMNSYGKNPKFQFLRTSSIDNIHDAQENINIKDPYSNGGEKYSINADFTNVYDKWAKNDVGSRQTGRHFVLGTTSQALQSIGIKDTPIIIDQSKIVKILNKHPEITDDIVKQIPQLLEEPILVMESKTESGSVTVLGEVYGTNGVPVMAALKFKNVGQRNNLEDYSVVTSSYARGKDDTVKATQNLIDTSEIKYVDPNKNRTDNWLATLGLQLPVHITTYGSIDRVSYSKGDVNIKGSYSKGVIRINSNLEAYKTQAEAEGRVQVSKETLEKRMLKTLATHEVMHALEENKSYRQIRDFVLKDLESRGVLEEVQYAIAQMYGNEIEGLSKAEAQNIIDSETVAKYVEDLFEDTDAKTAEQRIRELYSKDKNVFQKIYDAIKNLVARVKGDSIAQAEYLFEKVLNEAKSENAQSNETRNAINARFENQYDKWAKKADKTTPIKNRSTRGYFVLGTTSKALQSIGIKDTPIIIDQSKIVKILNKHPEITDDIVKQIPQLLEEPILVMESKTDSGSVTVLGEVYGTNSVPVMVALKFKNVGQRNTLEDYSVVTSAYTKATKTGINKTQSLIDSSKLLYIEPNKNRTDTWLGSLGLQLPSSAITKYGSINKISYSKGDVNIPGKIRQENTQYSKGGSIEEILAGKNGENAAEYFKSKANGAQKELLNFMPQAKSGGAALLREFAKDVLASDTAAYKEAAALWVRYGERAKEAGKIIARINSSHILSEGEKQAAEDISRGNRLNLAQYGSHAQTIEEYAQALKQERYIDEKTQSIFAKAFEEQRGRAKEVFDELYDNAFMEDSPEQTKIKEDIIKRLKSKMYVAPHVKAEFGDDYHPRMHGFNLTGNVNFNTQGNSVDSHYEDLSEAYPQYFPKDIINPGNRLKKMTEVMDALKTPNLLKEVYGEEYKRAAQEEFANMLGSIKKAAQRAMSINEIDIPQNIKNSEYYKEPAVKYLENTIDYDALTSLEIKAKKQAVTNVLKSLERMYGSFTQAEKAYAIKIAEGRMSADNLPDGIDRAAVLSYAEAYRIRFASELAETKRKALTDRALKKLKELKKVAREKGLSEADKSEIMRILGRYDYVSAFMSKQGELDTRRLAEEYRNILDEHPNAAITKGLEDKLNRLDKIRVSEMTADELYDLIQDVSAMEYSVRHMNDVLGVQQAEKITDAARQSIRAVEASNGFAPTTNRLFNAMRNQYGMNHLRPQTFFEQITGYSAEGGKLYEMLNEGTVRKAKFKGEATSLFDKFNSENKEFIEKMSGKDADWIEIEAGGKKYEITPAMRISLYLHSKNDANLRHFSEAISEVKGEDGKTHLQMLMGQGITIPNRKYYNKGMKSEAYLYGDTVKFTRAELAKIFEGMTAQEREFANLAHRYFNEVSKKAINETSMTLEGIETAQVDNYFPLQSDPNKLRQGKDVKAMQEALSNIDVTSKGFLKERKNARNAIILDDVTNILLNQIEAVSEYYGFAVAHRNFEAILAQVVDLGAQSGENYTKRAIDEYARERAKSAGDNGRHLTDSDLEGYLKTGLRESVRNRKQNLLESGKDIIVRSYSEMKDYIRKILKGSAEIKNMENRAFGIVGNNIADAIHEVNSDLNVYGYYLEIVPSDFKHGLKHMEAKREGNRNLTTDEISKAIYNLNEATFEIIEAKKQGDRQQLRLGVNGENGLIEVVAVVSNGRIAIQPKTIIGHTEESYPNLKTNIKITSQRAPSGWNRPTLGDVSQSPPPHAVNSSSDNTIPQNETKGNGETYTLEEVINKKWGKEATRYIEKLLQDNIGLNKSERSIWGALQGKFASAVLGLNPSVAIKQLSAYPTAGDVVGQKALVKGLLRDATFTPKQVRELDATIDKYTPMLAIRREGTGIREVGDVLKNNPQWAQKVPHLMQLPGLVDTAVVRKLWGACEYYVEDTLGLYKERLKNTDASDINELNVKSEVRENGQTGTETEPVTDSVGEGVQGEIRQRAGMGRLSRDEVLRGRDTIQRGQKGYEDFQKATEGTKITNKDGSPKIIYHGTNYDYDSFSNDSAGKNFEVKAGIFFTDNADVADLYSKLSKGNGERGIIPAAVKMMNPLVVNAKDIGWHRQRKLKETIDNANTIYGKQNSEELLKGYLSSRIKNERVLTQVLSAYENGKIDGIQIDDADWDSEKGKKNTQYIVFDAEQIVPAASEYWGNKKYVPQDEYYRQVAKVFEQCIFRTQQNYTPMQQSQILRDTRTSTKLLTLFSSQNNQNYNVLYEAVGRYRAYKEKYGKGSAEFAQAKAQLGRAVVSQILQGATFAGLGVFVKGFIKGAYDDKDEAAQDFFSQLISAFAGTVYGGQELYDLIMSAVNGEEWEGINVAVFGTIKKLGQNIVDLVGAIADIDSTGFTNNNVLQAVRSVAKSIGGLFGVPAENAEAYIKDIVGRVTENASGGEFSFEEWYDGLFYNGTAARVKKASREKRDTAIDDAIYDGMNSVYGKSGGDEVKRLTQIFADEDGYNISDIYAGSAPDRVTYNSQDYILTGSEKDRWRRTQNKAFGELNEFVESKEYKALSDDEKFKAVAVFAKSAKATADGELAQARKKELLASDDPAERAQGKKIEISDEYTRLKENGGNLADYAVYRSKLFKDDEEGYSQKEKKEILFGMDISEKSEAAIYSAVFEDKNTKEEDSVLYAVKQGISAKTFVGFTSQEFEGDDKAGQKRKWLLENCRDDKELQGMYERFMESDDTEEYKTIGYAAAQGVSPRKFVEFKQAVAEAKGSAGEAKTYSYWRNGKVVTEQYTGTESGSKAQEIYDELLGGGYSDKEIEVLYSMQFSDKIYPYAMEMGISPREYVKFKQAYANIPKGKGKKQRVFEAIESLKLSADKKMLLFCAQGYSLGTENKMRMFRYIDSLELSREQKMILADIMGFRVENGRVYVS